MPECEGIIDETLSQSILRESYDLPSEEYSNENLQCIPGHSATFDWHELCLYDIQNDVCPFGFHLKYSKDFYCTNSFKCTDSYCVPFKNMCDGKWDCPHIGR